jgi:cell division protease FtsH
VTQQFYKNMALWLVILMMILLLVTMLRQSQEAPAEVPYSKFIHQVEAGEIAAVTIEEKRIQGTTTSGEEFLTSLRPWGTS